MEKKVLEIKKLKVDVIREEKRLRVLAGVDLFLKKNESLCIVGESGCGKTILGLSILRLLPPNFHLEGEVLFFGKDLLKLNSKELEKLRGNEISMVFQDPMSSLNPVFKVGDQVKEVLDVHNLYEPNKRSQKVLELFKEVGLPNTKEFYNRYPHQLSGGQKQRVMIAMAIACNPSILIADEPTTALDVTIQAQIIKLFEKIKKEYNTSLIYITHDLHTVKHIADRVAIMYLGMIVEEGSIDSIFNSPLHPYTCGLLESIPSIIKKGKPLQSIPGMVPPLDKRPKGCVFHTRCFKAKSRCKQHVPELKEVQDKHFVRCFLYE